MLTQGWDSQSEEPALFHVFHRPVHTSLNLAARPAKLVRSGCDLERADLPHQFVPDLVELARRAEFLIVTLAGGESTKGIINADVLDALGPDGILINVSRGSTVDESALVRALKAKSIKGTGLDVFWNEPHIDVVPNVLTTLA
ncbi:MAG: hypothetical protein KGL35_02720 [Bradyrhizobium sp.]|nr:hypothetical protein [Pseudomonadota bacterium]MDE2066519.1 hypothetical protein [Bradyrhizobium sp.]MDE2467668.1 hypothetical protein [Bradyrhizobium sp.]